MSDGQSVPTGVKVIAVLYYIGAVLGIIFGLLFLVGAGAIGSIASQIPVLGALGAGLFIVGGIILIGLGVLGFFVGRGLWKARPWARIVAIIFAVLGILMAIISMIQGSIASNIFNLVIQLVIGGYLLFSNNVKQAFA
ncbi:MAG: hypothetical protein PVJ67_07055 [Candidatus Pacearchaeota archaeon]|jgi:hypothetical protein